MESKSVDALKQLFEINNGIIMACFKDLKPDHYTQDFHGISPIIYQAGHLTAMRYNLAKHLGIDISLVDREMKDPEMYNRPFDASLEYDRMEIKNDWEKITTLLSAKFDLISVEELEKNIETQLPITNKNILGLLSFYFWHEAYHLGQMGALRKRFGHQDIMRTWYEIVKGKAIA